MSKFFLALLVAVLSLPAEVLSVRADSWLPYNGDPKDSHQGYIIDILREIYEPQNITVDYKLLPWNRAIISCSKGEINAVVGAYAEDVQGFILPNEPVDLSAEAFFKLRGNPWEYKDISSLESQSLGYILDYATEDDLIKYIEKHKKDGKVQLVSGDNPLKMNIKKLLAGRLTVVLDNYSVIRYKLSEMDIGDDKITFAGYLEKNKKMFVAFSPKNPKSKSYAAIFDKRFKELKASGKVNEIRKRYKMDPLK